MSSIQSTTDMSDFDLEWPQNVLMILVSGIKVCISITCFDCDLYFASVVPFSIHEHGVVILIASW